MATLAFFHELNNVPPAATRSYMPNFRCSCSAPKENDEFAQWLHDKRVEMERRKEVLAMACQRRGEELRWNKTVKTMLVDLDHKVACCTNLKVLGKTKKRITVFLVIRLEALPSCTTTARFIMTPSRPMGTASQRSSRISTPPCQDSLTPFRTYHWTRVWRLLGRRASTPSPLSGTPLRGEQC